MVKVAGKSAAGDLESRGLLLFVPGNRPERFAKAAAAGADGIIVDLEDAVAASDKDAARLGIGGAIAAIADANTHVFVRINGVGTAWHEPDIAVVSKLSIAGVVLPKAERAEDLERIAGVLGDRARVIALVETAQGLASARSLARAAGRLAFGSIDYAADIGAAHSRESLLYARAEIVLASRLAALPGPIDGVTTSIDSVDEVEKDAGYAASLGFLGKLLVHPAHVAPAARGFRPSQDEIAWAAHVMAACAAGAVSVVDGGMVDAPVRARAEQILKRAARSKT
jgi:citrate lyase subunit beta/citryl-CoA lyase